MTICSKCKRAVKMALRCICGAVLGYALLVHAEPHVQEQLYPLAQIRIVDYAAVTSSSTSTTSAAMVVRGG